MSNKAAYTETILQQITLLADVKYSTFSAIHGTKWMLVYDDKHCYNRQQTETNILNSTSSPLIKLSSNTCYISLKQIPALEAPKVSPFSTDVNQKLRLKTPKSSINTGLVQCHTCLDITTQQFLDNEALIHDIRVNLLLVYSNDI